MVPGSTDSTSQNPSVLFRGANPSSNKDFEAVSAAAGNKVYVQYTAKLTYDEQATLRLLENRRRHVNVAEYCKRVTRVLVFDQFAGRLAEKRVRFMGAKNRTAPAIWGGLADLLQPAHLFRIRGLKSL